MITATSAASMSPPEKAQLIYQQARSDMASRLWRAALGVEGAQPTTTGPMKDGPVSLNLLIALLDEGNPAGISGQKPPFAAPAVSAEAVDPDEPRGKQRQPAAASATSQDGDRGAAVAGQGYGPNAAYAGFLSTAGSRTGLPPAALATIVHAEAAKDRDGRWMPYSRNPRSSAAGLGQFLSSTWCGEAARKGTWLNMVAEQQGWLGKNGKVKGEYRGALLAMRYDPEASIQATADYAASNLEALRKAGAVIGDSAQALAKAAYLGHHLGRGDAIKFLKGGLDPERARILLNAQVGSWAAARRIADSGNAAAAHRSWLNDYIGRNIRTDRFQA
jgi:hypothetical protein